MKHSRFFLFILVLLFVNQQVRALEIPLYNYNSLMLPFSVEPFVSDLSQTAKESHWGSKKPERRYSESEQK